MEPHTNHEWLYRASTSKENLEVTRALIRDHGFIHRSAFVEAAKEQMIANVAKVAFRDVIHLYFVDAGKGLVIGSYRVVGPNNHPRPELFGAAVKGAQTLRRVAPGELAEELDRLGGYQKDPRLEVHCGWPVVPDDARAPIYSPTLFPGRNSIAPYAGAPRRSR